MTQRRGEPPEIMNRNVVIADMPTGGGNKSRRTPHRHRATQYQRSGIATRKKTARRQNGDEQRNQRGEKKILNEKDQRGFIYAGRARRPQSGHDKQKQRQGKPRQGRDTR